MGNAVRRMRGGHAAAAACTRALAGREGPDPARAVAEALAAADALAAMSVWPGPRDPVSERAVEAVRRRWVRIKRRTRGCG